jgi:hypothetical protein
MRAMSQLTEIARPAPLQRYQLAPALAATGRPAGGRRHEVVGARSSRGTAEGPPGRARSSIKLTAAWSKWLSARIHEHERSRIVVSICPRAGTWCAPSMIDLATGGRVERLPIPPATPASGAAHALPGPCSAAAPRHVRQQLDRRTSLLACCLPIEVQNPDACTAQHGFPQHSFVFAVEQRGKLTIRTEVKGTGGTWPPSSERPAGSRPDTRARISSLPRSGILLGRAQCVAFRQESLHVCARALFDSGLC